MKTKYKNVYKEERTGHYFYSVYVRESPTVIKRYTKTFNTEEEANIAKLKLLKLINPGDDGDVYRTIAYLIHCYLKIVALTLKFTSLENTTLILAKYLKPFENLTLKQFCEESNLIAFRSFIQKSKIGINHKNKVLNIVGLFLKYVFKTNNIPKEYIYRTEMFLKKIPQNDNVQVLKNRYNFWTVEECKKFLNVIDSPNWKMFFYDFIINGERFGEHLAKKVSDLDFERREIHIQRQLVNKGIKNKKTAVETSLKTAASYRTIPMGEKLYKALKEYLARHPNAEPDDYLFFCSKTPLSRTTVRRVFNKYIVKAGVPKITIHGLRHTCATLLLSSENLSAVDINSVCSRLGHSSPRMTLNVYMGMHKKESEKIKKSLEVL